MTGVACRCNDLDVSCLRCVKAACGCGMEEKYLLSWWTEEDLSRFVNTAETFLRKLRAGRADTVSARGRAMLCEQPARALGVAFSIFTKQEDYNLVP